MLTRFVSADGLNTYTFPTSPGDQDFKTNFAKLNTRYSAIAGTDGALDEYGVGRAPAGKGQIDVTIYLVSDSRAGMQTLRDAIYKIQEWGVGQLVDTLNGVERFCICRANPIGVAEHREKHTDLQQPVKLVFEAEEPAWLTANGQTLWNGAITLNGAENWDKTGFATITGSGSISKTVVGSLWTQGRFVARVTGATAFTSLTITRLVLNGAADQLIYSGSLVQNDLIEISPRDQWCLVNGLDKTTNLYRLHPDWLRLQPGGNTLAVQMDESAAAISADVKYYERYK